MPPVKGVPGVGLGATLQAVWSSPTAPVEELRPPTGGRGVTGEGLALRGSAWASSSACRKDVTTQVQVTMRVRLLKPGTVKQGRA